MTTVKRALSLFEEERPSRMEDVLGNALIKKVVAAKTRRNLCRPGLLLHGPYGTGKTTLCRIIASILICPARPVGELRPCGACPTCRGVEQSPEFAGFWTRNAADYSLSKLKDDLDNAAYAYDSATKVLFIDEFNRAREPLKDLLLTTLESPDLNLVVLLASASIDWPDAAPLLQRLTPLKVEKPSTPELVAFMRAVCLRHGFREPLQSELERICEEAENAPRDCLNRLQFLMDSE
jgi:replication-associated recombination protein RarA